MAKRKVPREVLARSRDADVRKLDFDELNTAFLCFLAEKPSLREFESIMHRVPMSAFMLGVALGLKDE